MTKPGKLANSQKGFWGNLGPTEKGKRGLHDKKKANGRSGQVRVIMKKTRARIKGESSTR